MDRTITQIRAQVKRWLNRYASTYYDEDYGYSDCDMIDSCIHDLELQDQRALVNEIITLWINAQ